MKLSQQIKFELALLQTLSSPKKDSLLNVRKTAFLRDLFMFSQKIYLKGIPDKIAPEENRSRLELGLGLVLALGAIFLGTIVVVNRPIWRTFIRFHCKLNLHSRNTLFNHLLGYGFYGNQDLDLVILHSYMILEYDLNHFYTIFVLSYMIPEHFYTILNTLTQS